MFIFMFLGPYILCLDIYFILIYHFFSQLCACFLVCEKCFMNKLYFTIKLGKNMFFIILY